MCQSVEDGGQRCAAHTRPAFEAALSGLGAAVTDPAVYTQMYRANWELTDEATNVAESVAQYASTREGGKAVADLIAEHKRAHGNSNKFAMFLTRARLRGLDLAEANKTAAAEIRKARVKAERAARNSMGELRANPNIAFEKSLAGRYPQLAAMWDPANNNDVSPEHVAAKANVAVTLTCPQGHIMKVGRLNNYANAYDVGRRPYCDECKPRRQRQFVATREELSSLVDAIDGDPEAFACLTPTLQYSLLAKMGLLGGGQDSVQRNLAMSIVHGDLTLADVMAAEDLQSIEKNLREDLGDDEHELGAIDDVDLTTHTDDDEPMPTAVQHVMASAGALAFADPDSDLATHIMRENVDALWNQAYRQPDDLDTLLAAVDAHRGRSQFAAALADRFTAELDAARTMDLPTGYRSERILPDGSTAHYDPTLSQRRFMAMVDERKRVMNWSGTGAGKTIAATIAVQQSGARETLVVCPNAVVGQWKTEFEAGFPDHTEVRIGLPTGDEAPPPDGVNRVWVANYEKFQTDPDGVTTRTTALAGRVDAVVFDEIHCAKSDGTTTSRRRDALLHFTDTAGQNNPDLVVIGASATPVVNNLEEARSVLRLVEGPESRGFPTTPSLKNAATAHHRLAAAGIRHMPTYNTALTSKDVTVDITSNVAVVQGRLNALRQQADTDRTHASMMERALLPEKMPAIVAAVRQADGPSVVYTEYTKGMVAPMRQSLEREGFRVAEYTGQQTETERAEILAAFKQGRYDVVIGSRPIATGVDGLQSVCSNLVVASMPWTAAADDQLRGRFQRRGQQRDVTVTYVLAEAKVGKTRWSWCKDNRQRRVKFKRSLADAAVDGVMPDGTLDTHDQAEDAMAALRGITQALARREADAA